MLHDVNQKPPLGPNLAAARRDAHLSQAALAAKLDVSPRSVQGWEAGTTEPRLDTVVRIADLTNRSPSWFYTDHTTELEDAA